MKRENARSGMQTGSATFKRNSARNIYALSAGSIRVLCMPRGTLWNAAYPCAARKPRNCCSRILRGSRPVFGKGRADLGTATIFAFTDEIPDSGEFNIVLGPNEFGFVCYPVVYGLATFQDVDSSDSGGWD